MDVYNAEGGNEYTLDVHTTGDVKGYTLHTHYPYCWWWKGITLQWLLHIHTDGGGKGYTLHVHTAACGGGERDTPFTS